MTTCTGVTPNCIKVEVLDDAEDKQHFCLYFDRPGRAEISLLGNSIICHVYDGTKVDTEQVPLGAYDGSIGDNNTWEI